MRALRVLIWPKHRWLASTAVLFGLLALLPAVFDSFALAGARDLLLFALFAVGLDLFWGQSGILSFGHATFFGLGAYGMAVTTVTFGFPAEVASSIGLLAGVGLAATVALGAAYFLISGHVRGAYFTIITLAMSLIAQQIAVGWSSVTGGDAGLIGVQSFGIGNFVLADPLTQYYVTWALLLVVVVLIRAALRGHRGRVFKALQDNEVKLETLGYSASSHLIVLFVASATISALAGAVYATTTGFVAPDMIGLILSTEVIMWVAVGGRGTSLGAIIGTILVWQFQQRISSINASMWPLFMGGFFIVVVFLFPEGLASFGQRISAGIQRARRAPAGER